ncbi:unnamed protein product [Gongylonema pulchrum]|uniref:Transposase n=1 Tax=Gongylonema pulchrum TaxID=637853 RepID=A0A183EE17_9BILA|nr:unnamed protein product [Gongylonema pulchrum]
MYDRGLFNACINEIAVRLWLGSTVSPRRQHGSDCVEVVRRFDRCIYSVQNGRCRCAVLLTASIRPLVADLRSE